MKNLMIHCLSSEGNTKRPGRLICFLYNNIRCAGNAYDGSLTGPMHKSYDNIKMGLVYIGPCIILIVE